MKAPRPMRRVLVANRGEIAVRVIRACAELGLETVAIYSEVDREALHVRLAHQAWPVGPAPSARSYLRVERLLEVAAASGCDAVHPGYGFLSESADFAQAVIDAGLTWVGPPPAAIAAMGSKTLSRRIMRDAGVPVVPGSVEPVKDQAELRRLAAGIGWPVMLKASAGGGGKGMRLVRDQGELEAAWRSARAEARKAFADDSVYLEKALEAPRHVEVQLLADQHGQVIHLLERECSVQRRHQKVLEESPCTALDDRQRERLCQVAIRAARAVGYVGAGTVEFLRDAGGGFHFLEMNTRLQVEHPVTEMVTGVDLARAQLEIAMGLPLAIGQQQVRARGHAIECRIYAEDPSAGFMPCPGRIGAWREPAGPGVRVDSGVYAGAPVPVHYDPLIAKLVVWGRDRVECIRRTDRALREFRVGGLRTTIGFFRHLLAHPRFLAGDYDTGLVDGAFLAGLAAERRDDVAAIAAALAQYGHDHQPSPSGPSGSAWRRVGRWRATHRGLR